MLSKLLKRRPPARAPKTASVPEGVVVWAVGDIHGRLDLLQPLVDAIIGDARMVDADRKVVLFLGDYVDRGPDSRGVIQFLSELRRVEGIEWRFLMGNHEETLLNFLDDPSVGAQWCEYGGDATLRSYGLRPPDLRHKPEAWAHVSADFAHNITEAERDFLRALELSVTVGDYFFVHAGARPGVRLEQQSREDLLWIRRSFLDADGRFEQVVVHGHTPASKAYSDHRRIGVDTRAYHSGVLTAVRLEGETRRLVQTSTTDAGDVGVVGERFVAQV